MNKELEEQEKYLKFEDITDKFPASRKTKVFAIISINNGSLLGQISWYTSWRRYVFNINQGTFDSKCLIEIANKLDELMKERNANN